MTTGVIKQDVPQTLDERTPRWIRLAFTWHALLGAASLAGVALVNGSALLAWQKTLLSLLLLVYGAAHLASLPLIYRRKHAGRLLSLALNYLGFLFGLLGSLHVLGVFTGIDSLAGTFGRGIPYLGVILGGYLVGTLGDRYEYRPAVQKKFQQAARVIMGLGGIAFLLAVGLLPGMLSLLGRFNRPLPFFLTGAAVLFGFVIWIMWRKQTAAAFGATNAHAEVISGFLYLSPNLLGFLFFFAGPLLFSLYVSFTDWDAFGATNWVGLRNYAKIVDLEIAPLASAAQPVTEALNTAVYDEVTRVNIFGNHYIIGARDKLFWLALRNTFLFCLMAVPLSVIPALLLANLLNSKLPGMKFFRAVYFLPSIAAVVGVALIWQWLYNAAVGYINYGIDSLVIFLNQLPFFSLPDPDIRWLSDTRTALLAVVIMSAWQWTGFNTVLFLAGLQNIPAELYEAATVDGAGKVKKFQHITLPMLAPTTFFVLTTAIISALQLFEQVYVLIPTEPPGGPNNSTLSLVLYLYMKGFQRFEQGYASAVAWVLFVVIFSVTLLQYRRQRAGSGAY